MRRILVAAITAALSLTVLFATPVLAASATWHVQVGAAGITPGVGFDGRSANAFYPGRIAAHAGDKIAFDVTSPHTVTFNRPANTPLPVLFAPAGGTVLGSKDQFLNSGFNPAGFAPFTFTVTLADSLPPGRIAYICALHFGMRGVIDIVPASVTLPKHDLAAEASQQIARDLAAGSRAAEEARDFVEDHPRTVLMGAGTRRVSNLRFFPATITIKAGESIRFLKTRDPSEPHTFTIGTEPPNPFAPAGGPPFVFNGTNSLSTGAMMTQRQFNFYIASSLGVPSAVTRETITFTKAGTYQYICAIHDEAGMRATVVVTP